MRVWDLESTHKEAMPCLPSLITLIAHDSLAACILQRPDNCRYLRHLRLCSRSPGSMPRIITDFCLPGTEVALAFIASHVPHPIKIEFDLDPVADFSSFRPESAHHQFLEIPRKLSQVHDITISFGNWWLHTNFLLRILPRFLGSFPALERLCLNLNISATGRTDLYAAFRNSCPRLKYFMVNEIVVLPVQD